MERAYVIYIYICMCAQSWHYFLAVQPSTIVHFCLGIGGGGKVSGKSICEIYICMCAQSWHCFLAVQPSTSVHFFLGLGGVGVW